MKDFITDFAKEELRIMIEAIRKDGAPFKLIASKTGVSIHKLRRLMYNGSCDLTQENFSSITKYYANNCINR